MSSKLRSFARWHYVDLVSIIVEEAFDAVPEALRLAEKYDAEVVGAIPPLRVYQLRLSVRDLVHRDAVVLRLGGEESVDTVVIEESSAEDAEVAPQQAARAASELVANRFADAVDYYRRRVPGPADGRIEPAPLRLGIIERSLDFDAVDLPGLIEPGPAELRVYGRDAKTPDGHGSTIVSVLAARRGEPDGSGFLRALDGHHGGIDIIVDRGSDAGIAANVATSVRLVQDGARVLNWSWGLHRVGAFRVDGTEIGSALRSGVAFEGYEELLEEFFLWLTAPILPSERAEQLDHPDVGRSARLDMRKALLLTVESLHSPE